MVMRRSCWGRGGRGRADLVSNRMSGLVDLAFELRVLHERVFDRGELGSFVLPCKTVDV